MVPPQAVPQAVPGSTGHTIATSVVSLVLVTAWSHARGVGHGRTHTRSLSRPCMASSAAQLPHVCVHRAVRAPAPGPEHHHHYLSPAPRAHGAGRVALPDRQAEQPHAPPRPCTPHTPLVPTRALLTNVRAWLLPLPSLVGRCARLRVDATSPR
jgi:hypothetical protein